MVACKISFNIIYFPFVVNRTAEIIICTDYVVIFKISGYTAYGIIIKYRSAVILISLGFNIVILKITFYRRYLAIGVECAAIIISAACFNVVTGKVSGYTAYGIIIKYSTAIINTFIRLNIVTDKITFNGFYIITVGDC